MKKNISLLLALLFGLPLTLAACGPAGQTGPARSPASPSPAAAEPTEEPAAEPTVEPTAEPAPSGPVESDVFVEAVPGLSDGFIRGADVSSVLAEEASGVKYYGFDGREQDIFQTLAQAGVNWVRVRVWNDPYDGAGHCYGGGNNDAEAAAEIGRRAAEAGLRLLVDFHYSDFWSDPSKYYVPKAWDGMTVEEKCAAIAEYTQASLNTIAAAGADIGMVQIGNEINNGMCGETDPDDIIAMLKSASAAVRAWAGDKEVKIAVHLTNVDDPQGFTSRIARMCAAGLDFDVVGASYYPFWHEGTAGTQGLADVLSHIAEDYGKEVMVAEVSYPYTTEDGDGSGNSSSDAASGYGVSVQSQANAVRDIAAAVASVGEAGLGLFYWEPAWIPVQVYDPSTPDAAEVLAENRRIWEEFGSGWATSWSGDYDADAAQYYGGSSWDNQALFDWTGHPLPSLKVFGLLSTGSTAPLAPDYWNTVEITVMLGEPVELPNTVPVVMNDRSEQQAPVTWDAKQAASVDPSVIGEYTVEGVLENGGTVTAHVAVTNTNLVTNGSFENGLAGWTVTGDSASSVDAQNKESDAHSGAVALHFWSTSAQSFEVSQTVTGLEDGSYTLSCWLQGGDCGGDAQFLLFAEQNGERTAVSAQVDGWANWQNPTVRHIQVTGGTLTVGIRVKAAANGWGTVDDFSLVKE